MGLKPSSVGVRSSSVGARLELYNQKASDREELIFFVEAMCVAIVLTVVLVWATTTSYQVYLSCDSLVRGMGGIENDGI